MVGTVVGVVPGSSAPGLTSWAASIVLTPVEAGLPRPGVGSKWVHPTPARYTSGQACAWRPRTMYSPGRSVGSPVVKPTATRAGIPSDRAMAPNEVANCSQ